MNRLEEIYQRRKERVAESKELYPIALLEQSVHFKSPAVSLSQYLTREDKSGIIAEFKRRSPSKGDIDAYAKVRDTTIAYMQAGASALSVLTEPDYFSGRNDDLTEARRANYCPILRKDFILDEYQIIEARSIGADAILLIAAMLDTQKLQTLYNTARSLGLEVLVEVHSEEELDKLPGGDFILGVNNRNLQTMKVDIATSYNLRPQLSDDQICISESGLKSGNELRELKKIGYQGFLIGEQLMRASNPGVALAEMVKQMHSES